MKFTNWLINSLLNHLCVLKFILTFYLIVYITFYRYTVTSFHSNAPCVVEDSGTSEAGTDM